MVSSVHQYDWIRSAIWPKGAQNCKKPQNGKHPQNCKRPQNCKTNTNIKQKTIWPKFQSRKIAKLIQLNSLKKRGTKKAIWPKDTQNFKSKGSPPPSKGSPYSVSFLVQNCFMSSIAAVTFSEYKTNFKERSVTRKLLLTLSYFRKIQPLHFKGLSENPIWGHQQRTTLRVSAK